MDPVPAGSEYGNTVVSYHTNCQNFTGPPAARQRDCCGYPLPHRPTHSNSRPHPRRTHHKMQRAFSPGTVRASARFLQLRHGSSGGAPTQLSARWAETIRSESNIATPDDPPSAPLHETHELGEGQSDFANYVDKYEDVSTMQAVTGLGTMLLFTFGIYKYATKRSRESTPLFTRREFPHVREDFPNWPGVDEVRR